MSDANSCFENLERNLKKISIVLIDDFEEIKKGTPGPVISLIRKLLFNTSTVMMKSMLLRGVASHVPDKKLIIATFDLLRETVKYSPQITIDQFFSTVSYFNFYFIFLIYGILLGLFSTQVDYPVQTRRICWAC
jgi:hypothetical protein